MPVMLFKMSIAILLGVFLVQTFDLKLTALIGDITEWHYFILAACIPITLSSFFSANRWQVFLRINSIDETFATLWKISLMSQFQGLIFPSTQGGDAFRIFHIERRHPNKQGLAGSTVIIERMMGLLVLCACTLSALPFLPSSKEYTSLIITVGTISSLAVGVQFLLISKKIYRLYNHYTVKNATLSRLLRYIQNLHASMVNFPYRRAVRSSLLYIFCYQISLISVVYLVFRSYGYDIPFVQHFALYPVIAILTMIPITIGGLGVREGFFVYFYSLLGVPANIAVGASLANYAIMALIPSAFGGIIYILDTVRESRLRNKK
ncbi:lysylphosphatidylglycerol synthase transmembrane domain-containing protein [Pseudomonas corrugata]|uniref:lysylphosphatidylglycerol synthase transmembrane domain-containing protein n=1 Tax=Pseudomonas corrugata TaxID=47879 RepID=UPI0017A2E776|nr:lysylphosphatidylglycerol synthase transmembrane domain-containing protein [Pseudomonas corrugata]MCI0994199.1 flippase-like domain-containing protein [Pseudomonas corrugata]NUT67409.1 flippase-like domain-containing protein [Pseudomonas corrugata]